MLWLGAAFCFVAVGFESYSARRLILDNLYLGLVLVAVVVISGVFAYFQEAKSNRIMESFKKMAPQVALVI